MNNLFRVIVPAAFAVLAASCTQEICTESIPANVRKYSLTIDQPTKTDISGTGSKRSVSWTEGDAIKYYTESGQSSAVSVTVDIEGNNASVEIPRGRTDEFINAVYGASQLKSSTSTENTMYVTSPVNNAQRFTSFAQAHICAAFSDDLENPNLQFHNAAAVLKFTSTSTIHKVVFYGNNDEVITGGSNGDLKISYNGGALTTEVASTGGTSVTVQTGGTDSDFYIAILPVTFTKGITVDCYDESLDLIVSQKTSATVNTLSGSGTPKIINLGNAQDWMANQQPVAVDLGLSVKWARCNVGATQPEEFGDYFSWGETAPKSEYKWANYSYSTGKNGPFSEYVLDPNYGTVDHKTVLDPDDDAAHSAWGDDWRMPSKEEFEELRNSCTWTWTEKNGVKGYRVTSNVSGYTGNSIFLPANGMFNGSSLSDGDAEGNYWTASLSGDHTYHSISPYFSSSSVAIDNCYRYFGLGIRPVQGAVVPVASIELSPTLDLIVGRTATLSATISPSNATYKGLSWSSTDESIATVDANGKVTSIAPGTATITAYSADGIITATCVVSSNQLAESITLDKATLEMYVGDEPVTLKASILPETTTNKSVSWTSSKISVATVDEEGKITAVAIGTASITATAKDGSGKSATCAVTVKTHVESVSLDKTEITIYSGGTTTLTATVLPSNASNKSVTWTSSDDGVTTVSGSGLSATVKGVSHGNAIITATTVDGAKKAICTVTVKEPDYNGHDYVDLGLPSGLMWATMNVGASAPEEYGDYFAWGETEPKAEYNWSTYKWCNGNWNKLTKYCIDSSCWDSTEPMDNKTTLDPEDDAAHVNWGGSWRMPTLSERQELLDNCTWTWTTQNGVNGRLVTSKTNSNSIFLPAAGYRYVTNLSIVGSNGRYWSSSLNKASQYFASYVYFDSVFVERGSYDRYYGFSVRPVSE